MIRIIHMLHEHLGVPPPSDRASEGEMHESFGKSTSPLAVEKLCRYIYKHARFYGSTLPAYESFGGILMSHQSPERWCAVLFEMAWFTRYPLKSTL